MNLARWIAPLALLGLFADARADDDDIEVKDLPRAVTRAVKKAYPEAKIVGASKEKNDEGETVFEVETRVDGKSIDLIVDDEGEIEAVEKEIEVEDLPRAVLKAARAKYPRAKIAKVEEVTDEEDHVVYEIAFEAEGKKDFEVLFSPNGKIVDSDTDDDDDQKAKKKDKDDDEKAKGKKDKEDDEKEKPKG